MPCKLLLKILLSFFFLRRNDIWWNLQLHNWPLHPQIMPQAESSTAGKLLIDGEICRRCENVVVNYEWKEWWISHRNWHWTASNQFRFQDSLELLNNSVVKLPDTCLMLDELLLLLYRFFFTPTPRFRIESSELMSFLSVNSTHPYSANEFRFMAAHLTEAVSCKWWTLSNPKIDYRKNLWILKVSDFSYCISYNQKRLDTYSVFDNENEI